jgi:hypothetical protein
MLPVATPNGERPTPVETYPPALSDEFILADTSEDQDAWQEQPAPEDDDEWHDTGPPGTQGK